MSIGCSSFLFLVYIGRKLPQQDLYYLLVLLRCHIPQKVYLPSFLFLWYGTTFYMHNCLAIVDNLGQKYHVDKRVCDLENLYFLNSSISSYGRFKFVSCLNCNKNSYVLNVKTSILLWTRANMRKLVCWSFNFKILIVCASANLHDSQTPWVWCFSWILV